MRNNLAKLPDNRIVVVLTGRDILKDLIVRQHFLVLVIVDGDAKLVYIRIGSKIVIMLLNGFHDACPKALAILLLIHEECLTNQIRGMKDRDGRGIA